MLEDFTHYARCRLIQTFPNGIKNQRITKAQDRILNRMAKFTKRMPLPPPSAAPAADPDAPAPHTTADGSTWSSRCNAGAADSTDRGSSDGRKRYRCRPRSPDHDRATPTSDAGPCRAGRITEPAGTPADTAPARDRIQADDAGSCRREPDPDPVQTTQIHCHHRMPVYHR